MGKLKVRMSGSVNAEAKPKPVETSPKPMCPEISTVPRHANNDVAVLALGWFWHPQRDFKKLGGVVNVVVGYTGGDSLNPSYQYMKDATEAILVEFNPEEISYIGILNVWANMHSPRQPPRKRQYRSAIFFRNDEQRVDAFTKIQTMEVRGPKVYSDIEPLSAFYRAEEYHQDFVNKRRKKTEGKEDEYAV